MNPGEPRWLGRALIAAGLAMIPWLIALAVELPSSSRAQHWSTAWVGLDTMETLGLVTTGVLLRLRDRRCCLAAAATAALLLADVWFDVTTAASGADRLAAVLLAVLLEVPAASLCAVLAVRTLGLTSSGAPARRVAFPADRGLSALDGGAAQGFDHLFGRGLRHLDQREAVGDLDRADVASGQA